VYDKRRLLEQQRLNNWDERVSYRLLLRKLFGWMKNQRLLALFFSSLFLFLGLPGVTMLFVADSSSVIGIPTKLFFLTLFAPLIGMFSLSIFLGIAEDNDRHDPELENE